MIILDQNLGHHPFCVKVGFYFRVVDVVAVDSNVEICTKLNQYAGNQPKVPVPAKVNHHVYRSVPPRMERLSFHKAPFRYLKGAL